MVYPWFILVNPLVLLFQLHLLVPRYMFQDGSLRVFLRYHTETDCSSPDCLFNLSEDKCNIYLFYSL